MNYICIKCRRRTTNALGCYSPGCGGLAFSYSPIETRPAAGWELRLRLPVRINAVPLGALARLNPRIIKDYK